MNVQYGAHRLIKSVESFYETEKIQLIALFPDRDEAIKVCRKWSPNTQPLISEIRSFSSAEEFWDSESLETKQKEAIARMNPADRKLLGLDK